MSESRTSLKDISKKIGISVSTISRVLNNYTEGFSVKPEIRQKILDAVKEAGYRPNPVLRTMRAKKTMLVSYLDYKNPEKEFGGVIDRALLEMINVMTRAGYQVSTNFLSEEEPEQYMPQWSVDGVIIPDVTDVGRLSKLEMLNMNYVCMNGICGKQGASVLVDEEQCSEVLYKYLYELGHRKIAYSNKNGTYKALKHYSVASRMFYYEAMLKKYSLQVMPEFDNYYISPRNYLSKLVLESGVTAIVAYDHHQAMHLIKSAHEMGIRVPEQVSIVCYNDEYPIQYMTPPLSCVGIPSGEMGRLSAEILLQQMNLGRKFEGKTFYIQGSLVLRESACRPPVSL